MSWIQKALEMISKITGAVPNKKDIVDLKREVDKIIVHCSDSPDDRDVRAADIDLWHKSKGWKGIGYHYVITRGGKIEPGRDLNKSGAHTSGYNRHSIGICLIGRNRFRRKQLQTLRYLITHLRREIGDLTVHGHREFNKRKTCPNFDVKKWMKTW